MAKNVYDQHFRIFAKSLEMAIAASPTDESQKNQVEGLIDLENRFRKELNSHGAGRNVYKEFINYILNEKKNILSARPYFRERQKKFSARISPAFKKQNFKAFKNFRFNYTFILFALKVYKGPAYRRTKLEKIAKATETERDMLIKRNLPLAINRAKIFWKKVPKVNHEYMDMVQMASEGLISAVDKFVPPYRTVFRSVAIGRMVGNMIEASSETMLHFYPSDKRELYKANQLKHRNKLESVDDIAEEMNKERAGKEKITPGRLYNILKGASHVSMDYHPTDENNESLDLVSVHSRIADENADQAKDLEMQDTLSKIKEAFVKYLTIVQRKIFALKGQFYD